MKSIYLMFLVTLMCFNTLAQSLNDYKYVLVPHRYSWTNEADQYQINSLTTFLFNKYGFEAIQLGGTVPFDMNQNKCNTLTADVIENDTFVRVKLKVVLKDCDGNIVFITEEGTSKNKDYKWAYQEALREAFYSIEALKHSYNGDGETANDTAGLKAAPNELTPDQKDDQVPVREEVQENLLVNGVKESQSHLGTYRSQDKSYYLNVLEGGMVFYEGDKKIGALDTEKQGSYPVNTSEFSGKGYFLNNQFIIEREIKGVQGIIKMIFEKE